MYRLLRAPLFRLPAETAHEAATAVLRRTLSSAAARAALRRRMQVDDPALRVRRWGIDFGNPVGVAAGFDKQGRLFNQLSALGFGFVEIGTVTAEPQPGNPRPRLFRLPADRALLNRMGFNNVGAEAMARQLAAQPVETVLGVNLGKSKVAALEDAAEDYRRSVRLLAPYARYLVVNVSSPNTPGLRQLQDAEPLRALLRAVRQELAASGRDSLPLLLKLAPDLSDAQLEQAVGIARDEGTAGIVAVNTTISRAGLRTPAAELERLGAGGISGAPLRARALEVVRRIYRQTGGALPIIGVGGVRTADDAWQMIRAGACLVQLYTGLIYEGPGIAREICLGLREHLRRAGLGSIEEAVGTGAGR